MSRVLVRKQAGAHVSVSQAPERHLVRAHQPQRSVVLAGVRGRQGNSAFQDWLLVNPGGTWDDFLSELGSGATWQTSEW